MSSPAQPPLLSNVHSSHTYFPFNVSSKTLLTRASILVIAALLMSGCSDSPSASEPTTPLQPSASATAEPSPTPTAETLEPNDTVFEPVELEPPILPEAAKEETEEGAIAFAEYFLELLEYSVTNTETDSLREISLPDCAFCTSIVDNLDQYRSKGSRYTGYDLALESVRFHKSDGTNSSLVLSYTTSAYTFHSAKTSMSFDRESSIRGLLLVWDRGWQVNGFGVIAK